MAYAFETKDLTKRFGSVNALSGVSLAAEEGKIFALLGPNGAGKTTIVRILSTLVEPTGGSASVHGIDVVKGPEEVRKIIGLAGQYAAVDEFQTGYENVYMTGLLYGLNRREARRRGAQLIRRLGLSRAADRPVKTYSGGMRRRLDLGASLVGEPRALFLDEPTTGLDPKSRQDIWGIIRELVENGTSILLTTQYLEEADGLADSIAVVNEGKVIAEGTSRQLKSQFGGDIVEFKLSRSRDYALALRVVKRFAKKRPDFDVASSTMRVSLADGSKAAVPLIEDLAISRVLVESLSVHQPSLDDVFLALTGARTEVEATQADRVKRRGR